MYFLATCRGRSIRYRLIFIANYLLLRAATGTPRSEDMWFNLITDIGFKTSSTWNLNSKRFRLSMTWIPGLGDPRRASEPFHSAQRSSGSGPSICVVARLAIRLDNPRADQNAPAWPVQIPSYLGKNLTKQTDPAFRMITLHANELRMCLQEIIALSDSV